MSISALYQLTVIRMCLVSVLDVRLLDALLLLYKREADSSNTDAFEFCLQKPRGRASGVPASFQWICWPRINSSKVDNTTFHSTLHSQSTLENILYTPRRAHTVPICPDISDPQLSSPLPSHRIAAASETESNGKLERWGKSPVFRR